jgi:hypothetical protein
MATTVAFGAVSFLFTPPASAATGGVIRITEWMYQGNGGEYIELTNVGDAPVDMTGWSYDDDSRIVGAFDLSGFGTVAAGESVVFTESNADTFRANWQLCDAAKVLGGYTNNIGREDEINIFDSTGQVADRLAYGDDTIGGIRTSGTSGVVSAAGLGANNALEWSFSQVGDAEGTVRSLVGDTGSPGHSSRAAVAFDPCNATSPDSDTENLSVNVPQTGAGEFTWSISGENRDVQLTDAENSGTFLESTGAIVPIVVTDTRTGGPEWSISGQVSDFNNGLSGKYLGWTPNVQTPGAGATAGAPVESGITSGNGLTDSSTLASASAGHPTGSASLGADLDLRLPVDTTPGSYTATLTITALS